MNIPTMNLRHLLAGVAIIAALAAAATIPDTPKLAPLCADESANGCYWDARTSGNGEGTSFYACDDGRLIVTDSRPTIAAADAWCER